MIPELGHVTLIIGFCLALAQSTIPLLRIKNTDIEITATLAKGQCCFVIVSFLILVYGFLTHDFSIGYVAQHSNTNLPWYYRISAVWGGHEGSMLLWVMILNLWTVAVIYFSGTLPKNILTPVIAIMGIISAGFLSFILHTSNPFSRIWPPLTNGQDLNPLLQDFGLIIHPPMLYMGYVGFSVVFAFACATLINGKLDKTWLLLCR